MVYAFQTRGYRIWIPETNQIVVSIDVTFDENAKYDPESNGAVMGQNSGVDGLFPMGVVNQTEQVVEVVPEGIPGPPISPDSRPGGGGSSIMIMILMKMMISHQLFPYEI